MGVESVSFVGRFLVVFMEEGGLVMVPLGRVPLLDHAHPFERAQWQISTDGAHILWPALNWHVDVAELHRLAEEI